MMHVPLAFHIHCKSVTFFFSAHTKEGRREHEWKECRTDNECGVQERERERVELIHSSYFITTSSLKLHSF
jgi:hypothetical protein